MKLIKDFLGPYSFIIYYLLVFFYLSDSVVLGLVGLNLGIFGQKNVPLKTVVFFFLLYIVAFIFLSSFLMYFIIIFLLCTIGFLYVDRKSKVLMDEELDEDLVYYNDQRWSVYVGVGKTWFRLGVLAAFAGVTLSILQVEVLQGGSGGLFAQYTKCAEYAAGTTSCILQTSGTQLIGDRLAVIMDVFIHFMFFWVGMVLVIITKGPEIFKSLTGSKDDFMVTFRTKFDKFRKDHYI